MITEIVVSIDMCDPPRLVAGERFSRCARFLSHQAAAPGQFRNVGDVLVIKMTAPAEREHRGDRHASAGKAG